MLMTGQVAEKAVAMVLPAITASMAGDTFKRATLHVVVGTRFRPPLEKREYRADYFPELLIRCDIGAESEEIQKYRNHAYSKAGVTWRTGLPTRVVQVMQPELLLPGDIGYWGSWIERNIIAAAAGDYPHNNEYVSRLIIAACISLVDGARVALEAEITANNGYILDRRFEENPA